MPVAMLVLARPVLPRPATDQRHEHLVADGYTAVPLKPTESGYYWLVPCSYRGEPLPLLLDPGADAVALDLGACTTRACPAGCLGFHPQDLRPAPRFVF